MTTPAVSVVVIGRNEGERLERCLKSVAASEQPAAGSEVIYVDSASTDDSRSRAAALGATVLEVRPERPCAAVGRNAGWRVATAPLVLFLDGDTILAPDFVVHALREFENPEVAVVWGHRRELAPEESVFNRVLDLDWIYPPGISEFCGGDALMRRDVLEAVGGFDQRLIAGEEPEMCQRIRARGYLILHLDRPMTRHDLAITRVSQYWRRAVRAGYAYAEVSERLADSELRLWQSDARRNRLHAVAILAAGTAALVSAILFWSWLPLELIVAGVVLLTLRTERRIRWKSPSFVTRILYALHSHLQQVPIFFGQIRYWRDRRHGRVGSLIEYKGPGASGGKPRDETLSRSRAA